MVTLVPTPNCEATRILPPCPSIIPCEIAKPRPVPCGLVLKKGVNRCPRTASGMPSPWSWTVVVMVVSSASMETSMAALPR